MTVSSTTPETKNQADDSAYNKRVRRHVTGRVRDYYVITSLGFEEICLQELLALGIERSSMAVDTGGVRFSGQMVDCERANLHLRTGNRILMRINSFTATNERQLEKKTAETPWELFLPAGSLPDIKIRSRRSRLYHTDAISKSLLDGIARRFGGSFGSASPKTSQTVFVRVVDDRFTLSLDSSGESLYKRGLKMGQAQAPIRETQAAAILLAAGYDPRRPLVDPLCGSGTFSLEAAMMAKGVAPGVTRTFAFMDWPAFHEPRWAFLKRNADAKRVVLNRPLIFASDIDGNACERLSDTVTGNGLPDAIRVVKKDIFQCRGDHYSGGPGLVTINPPYGIRIGSTRQAGKLFSRICRHLADAFKGWNVALIVPNRDRVKRLPFAARRLPLFHGGLKLELVLGTIK